MPSTGYIKSYDLFKYKNGVILIAASEEDNHIPKKFIPQPKLASIYKEADIATIDGMIDCIMNDK